MSKSKESLWGYSFFRIDLQHRAATCTIQSLSSLGSKYLLIVQKHDKYMFTPLSVVVWEIFSLSGRKETHNYVIWKWLQWIGRFRGLWYLATTAGKGRGYGGVYTLCNSFGGTGESPNRCNLITVNTTPRHQVDLKSAAPLPPPLDCTPTPPTLPIHNTSENNHSDLFGRLMAQAGESPYSSARPYRQGSHFDGGLWPTRRQHRLWRPVSVWCETACCHEVWPSWPMKQKGHQCLNKVSDSFLFLFI